MRASVRVALPAALAALLLGGAAVGVVLHEPVRQAPVAPAVTGPAAGHRCWPPPTGARCRLRWRCRPPWPRCSPTGRSARGSRPSCGTPGPGRRCSRSASTTGAAGVDGEARDGRRGAVGAARADPTDDPGRARPSARRRRARRWRRPHPRRAGRTPASPAPARLADLAAQVRTALGATPVARVLATTAPSWDPCSGRAGVPGTWPSVTSRRSPPCPSTPAGSRPTVRPAPRTRRWPPGGRSRRCWARPRPWCSAGSPPPSRRRQAPPRPVAGRPARPGAERPLGDLVEQMLMRVTTTWARASAPAAVAQGRPATFAEGSRAAGRAGRAGPDGAVALVDGAALA